MSRSGNLNVRVAVATALVSWLLPASRTAQAQLQAASGQASASVRQDFADGGSSTDQSSANYDSTDPNPTSGPPAVANAGLQTVGPTGNALAAGICAVSVDQPVPILLDIPADFVVNANAFSNDAQTDFAISGSGLQTRTFNLPIPDQVRTLIEENQVDVSSLELTSSLFLDGFVGLITDAEGIAPTGLEARLEVSVQAAGEAVLAGTLRLFGQGSTTIRTEFSGAVQPAEVQMLIRDVGDGRKMVLAILSTVDLPFTYTVAPETPFDMEVTLNASINTVGGTTGGSVVLGTGPAELFDLLREASGAAAVKAQLDEAEAAVNAALGITQTTEPLAGPPCFLPVLGLAVVGLIGFVRLRRRQTPPHFKPTLATGAGRGPSPKRNHS